jgi:hypothetical protein
MVKLLSTEVTLGINDNNYITANKNHVASQIAHQADLNNIKTLIFTDTKKNCDSFINNNNFVRPSPLVLTAYEQTLLELISIEFGNQSFTYVSQNTTYLPHHGLLTKLERALHESIFKRKDGINVMVATSTLAQGINLPAELVIISGNTRYDTAAEQQEEIDAHDLLNAAGRAGRAGEAARGLVLVIPSQIVSFNSQNNKITKFFMDTVKEVFSESDQCLDIQDPIKIILDKIHNNPEIDEKNILYFIERIPNVLEGDTSPFMYKTFGAYQARIRNDEEWIATRIHSANNAFRRIRNLTEDHEASWHDKLAAASGIPAQIIHDLADDLIDDIDMIIDFDSALIRLFVWLSESIERIETILRSGSINEVFGSEYTDLTNAEKQNFFLSNVLELCFQWVYPQPLSVIEAAIRGNPNSLGKCDKARKFALRLIPEIAYSAGIFSQVYQNLLNEIETPKTSILAVEMMSPLLKNGFNNIQVLALHNILRKSGDVTRMNTNLVFNKLTPFILEADNPNDFNSVRSAMEASYESYINF